MATAKTSEKIPDHLKDKVNPIKNRILFLSPSVVAGEEREATKDDFESLSNTNIGVGGFGRVYKVRHKASKNVYAIKVINKQKIIENDMVDQIKLEIRIMYKLDHPNIIKLYNHFEDESSFYLVLEYAPKGQLYTKLKLLGRLDERLAAQYIREVVSAVDYLHSLKPPIIHRDIKPENILLDENESSKLCDFGWSNFFNQESKRMTYCGTPEYLAPEMIKQAGHDESLDYWNIGVLMFELLTGRPPFEGGTQKEHFDNIVKVRINFPKDFPRLAKDLISRLLKSDPKERLKFKELIEHAWFKANPPYKKSTIGVNKSLRPPMKYETLSKTSPINSKKDASKLPLESDKGLDNGAEPKKDDREAIIEKLANRYQEVYEELSKIKSAHQDKVKELEILKRDNQELSEHLARLGKEFTPQAAVEAKKMAEEVQKLKILNKNREEVIAELDQKKAASAEYESKIKLLQQDLEAHRNEKNEVCRKTNELQEKVEAMEKKYEHLKQMHEQVKKEKEAKAAELESKLELLQMKLINKTEDEGENNLETMMDVVKTVLEEIRDKTFAKSKSKKDSEVLRQKLIQAYNKLAELNTTHDNEMYELQAQYSKKLKEAETQLFEEQKAFAVKEEQKIEILKKHLQDEGRNATGQAGGPEGITETNKIYEKQNKRLQALRSRIDTRGRELAELKGQIKGLGEKIEDLEYQYAVAKAQAYSSDNLDNDLDSLTASTRGSYK